MAELSIRDKARATHVKRWQIVRVARSQTLAEHSYLVTLLSEEICKVLDVRLSIREKLSMYEWAMYHDLIEVITGDLNTVVKTRIKTKMGKKSIDEIELGICDRYDMLKVETAPMIKAIVKCADLVEAISFLEVEGMGKHANSVQEGIKVLLNNHVNECQEFYPKYQWGQIVPLSETIYEDMR